jgi:hypothetical protein
MPTSSATAAAVTAAFVRCVTAGAFAAAGLRAVLVLGLAFAAAQLAVRATGGYLAPSWWWTLAAVPALAFAFVRARRERPLPAIAAAHLDRRLRLDGLLLCAHEGQALEPAWQQRLDERLRGAASVLPRTQWRRLAPMPLLAVLLAAGIALLPAPAPAAAAVPLPTVQAEIEQLGEALRDLWQRGRLPEDVKQELERQLAALQQKVAESKVPEWSDLDRLEERLEREELLAAAAEPDRPSGNDGRGETGATHEPATAASVAAAARALAAAGLLDKLPAAARDALRAAQQSDGAFAAGMLPQDPQALAALAEVLADAAGQLGDLRGLEGALGRLGELADLRDIVERFGARPDEHVHGPECKGGT